MAEEIRVSKAPYPAPPPFWQSFTAENVALLKEAEASTSFEAPTLPYNLAVLRPPPHPTSTTSSYSLFSAVHTLPPQPTLPPEDEHLFDYAALQEASGDNSRDHVRKLRQLLKSINLNFLELYSIMGDNPLDWEEKIRDVGILTENFNAVINVLRPHQTREQVKIMLERRLDEGRDEIERMDQKKIEIEAFLKQIGDEEQDGSMSKEANGYRDMADRNEQDKVQSRQVEEARRTWELLDTLGDD